MDDTVIKYRCNACGYNYHEATYCHHCGTPQCPNCKRAGCIVNRTEMRRMVSHSIPNSRDAVRIQPKKAKAKKAGRSLERLLERTAAAEARHGKK